MPISETDRAFRIVLAAQESKNELFCRKARNLTFLSSNPPNRFSVNVILGVKHLIEGNLDVTCFICGGGYGCFRFELGSDQPEFCEGALTALFAEEEVVSYLGECAIYSVGYWGNEVDGAKTKKELLHTGRTS